MAFVLKDIDADKFVRGVTGGGRFDTTDNVLQAKVYPTSVEALDDVLLFRVRGPGRGGGPPPGVPGQGPPQAPRLQLFEVQPLVLGEGI